ncbi:MAG: 30S ribosomal protein S4 [Bacilli bacterium]|nr:30S ribosomal protein S4 [Bacilli bacterium]
MARYTGPNNKQSRRVGFSVLESGVEFAKGKKRVYGPGQHGADRKRKPSNYSIQLKEKQKARFMYQISEKQFKKLVMESGKMKGVHGENLLFLLESRLDNLVYRAGFAATRRGSRQLVNHGHVTVNGKKVDIPSYRCKIGDVISLKEDDKNLKVVNESLEKVTRRVDFIKYDDKKKEATYVRRPERNELNAEINEALIVEFYSRV